jgi:phosphoglycolate phosphatase
MSGVYEERDFVPVASVPEKPTFLPGTQIEIIRPVSSPGIFQYVFFDFDGTLSLVREGWQTVMVPMMVEELLATGTEESPEELERSVTEFVANLTGKQTIYQMIRLAEEIRKRGKIPEDPLVYKRRYHDLLMQRIAHRREALRGGKVSGEEMLVPGALPFLTYLKDKGLKLYLASGTDEIYVREEARLLGLECYFGEHIYGAIDAYQTFSKATVIERLLRENQIPGEYLLGFGDGFVDIQTVKAVGGTAVAVASDERNRSGKPDPWKRERLIQAGADLVIPDYQEWPALVGYLWGELPGPRDLSCS